jgi:hypothetical protein
MELEVFVRSGTYKAGIAISNIKPESSRNIVELPCDPGCVRSLKGQIRLLLYIVPRFPWCDSPAGDDSLDL